MPNMSRVGIELSRQDDRVPSGTRFEFSPPDAEDGHDERAMPAQGETDARALKGHSGLARIVNAAGHSMAGLKAAYRGEAAFRQLLLLNLVLIPLACVVDVNKSERVLLILVLLLSLVVELFNSAIEAAIDRVSLAIHPLSKQAKDMGSAAQMLALAMIVLTWAMILL